MTTTTDPRIMAKVKQSQERIVRALRTRHEAEGCDTWERTTYRYRDQDGEPIVGMGCREHAIFTTAGI